METQLRVHFCVNNDAIVSVKYDKERGVSVLYKLKNLTYLFSKKKLLKNSFENISLSHLYGSALLSVSRAIYDTYRSASLAFSACIRAAWLAEICPSCSLPSRACHRQRPARDLSIRTTVFCTGENDREKEQLKWKFN
jgi:hypothetical protein